MEQEKVQLKDDLILVQYFVELFEKGNGELHVIHEAMYKFIDINDNEIIDDHLKAIRQELAKIYILVGRMQVGKENNIDFRYTSLDIELFFVKYRTVIDHILETIKLYFEIPPKPKKNLWEIFEILNQKIEEHQIEDYPLLKSSLWFKDIADYRNGIVHGGSNCMVFNHDTEIIFQIFDLNFDNIINDQDYLKYEKNVYYFRYFLVVYMAYLHYFLDDIFNLMITLSGRNIKSEYQLLEHEMTLGTIDNSDIIKAWCNDCINAIKQELAKYN
ncbi:hypothetical protein WAX74_01460 [Psychrobacillus sp. FJAT-51614]|uniref:Apea-like HEPN domain-containing protein n=1 Tax=Psychrobacillus mangrovi TaxID=3117745 RepID=A0ABU8EZZ1_9BACI